MATGVKATSQHEARRLTTISSAQPVLACASDISDSEQSPAERMRLAQLVEWAELVILEARCTGDCPPSLHGARTDENLLQ